MSNKTIETLIPDILDVVAKGGKIKPEYIDEFFNELKENLIGAIEEGCAPRKQTVRMSGLGTPNRKLWYSFNSSTPKKALKPQNAISFMYGHIVEAFILMLAKHAGHEVTRQQETVKLEGVTGHIDCFIDGVLTDAKSASSYGMNKFKTEGILRGNDPYGYVDQISGYAEALEQNRAAFLAVDKSNGEMALVLLDQFDLRNSKDRIKEVRTIIADEQPPETKCYPAVAQGKSGNMKLDKPCTWCDFKNECWAKANNGLGLRKFEYSGGPEYFVHVEKQPKVSELGIGGISEASTYQIKIE